MATKNSDTFQLTTPSEREFVITRVFDAPRELVWEAWTKPEHIARWWGCDEATITVCESDLRPGGQWRNVLRMPDGAEFGFNGVYCEISAPERLVHTFIYEPMPKHSALVTVTFEERDGKTLLTETTRHESTEARDGHLQSGMEGGVRQSLDRLEKALEVMASSHLSEGNGTAQATDSAEPELVITRVFDAPRELVWKAWSEAERLAQWWGPKGCAIQVARLEFRPGGIFHYNLKTPDGGTMWGKFVYHEIAPQQCLIFVSSFSDENANTTRAPFSATFPLEISNTLTLAESDGKTTLMLRGAPVNATTEERATFQAMHASMRQGFGGTFDQLAEYLKTV